MRIIVKQRAKNQIHPNSLKNLRSFKKGQSGNPKGRPIKDLTLTSLLKEEITKIPAEEKEGRTWRQLLVLAWLSGSLKNPILLKELLDRLEGKVAVPVQIDIQAEARKVAQELGLDPEAVLKEAEAIIGKH